MKVFYEDGCSFHATAKYKGGLAPGQVHGALKWADQLAERVRPIEESAQELPDRIKSLAREGRLAAVTGAGVSISCGLPSWYSLVNRVAREILRKGQLLDAELESVIAAVRFADDLLSFSRSLTAISPESDVNSTVASCLYPNKVIRSPLLSSLGDLVASCLRRNRANGRPTFVLTFNYDTLLEEELGRRRISAVSMGRMPRIEDTPVDSVHVVHAHGMLHRSKTSSDKIVFTEQSYGDAYLRTPGQDPLSVLLASDLRPLFVGFSFRDHFVRRLLQEASMKAGEPVALGLLSKADLVHPIDVPGQSFSESGYTQNDVEGWRKFGSSPLDVRRKAIKKVPEHLARWILHSVGVEWLSVTNRPRLAPALKALAE